MAAATSATVEAEPSASEVQQSKLSAGAQEFTPTVWASRDAALDDTGDSSEEPQLQLRGGYFDASLGWWVPYYTGSLKSYNMRSGYGFVHCEQTTAIYKTDVFIHKSQMIMPWRIGQPLEFAVTMNGRGQPQAVDVMWLPMGMVLPNKSDGLSHASDEPVRKPAAPEQKARVLGTLKSYSAGQGYGFVSSDEIFEQHTRDAYLDRGQLPPAGEWRIGQAVEFEVGYNGRGHPQVRHVNWDPVSHFPKDINNPAGAGGLKVMTAPMVEPNSMRTLNRILTYIREGDMSTAVRMAVDLQEDKPMAVDHVSFVLDRLGTAKTCSGQLTGIVSMLLLIKLTQMLSGQRFDKKHTVQSLAWCEAILPTLQSKQMDGMSDQLKFGNVIGLVRENLEAAAHASQDTAYEPALACLREMA